MDVLEQLLDAGQDINALTEIKAAPLTLAARTNMVPVLERLVSHGADLDNQD
jgi:ankyrin repeat protein